MRGILFFTGRREQDTYLVMYSGLAIKVCLYDESAHIPAVHTEEKIFYTEDDYREYLVRRGYTGVREIDGYNRIIDNMDDLRNNAMYRGVS